MLLFGASRTSKEPPAYTGNCWAGFLEPPAGEQRSDWGCAGLDSGCDCGWSLIAFLRGAGAGARTGRTPAAPTRGTGTSAGKNWLLVALTQGTGLGAGTGRTSAAPTWGPGPWEKKGLIVSVRLIFYKTVNIAKLPPCSQETITN